MSEANLNTINKIIRKSFGYGFKGNYDIKDKEFIDGRLKLDTVDSLLMIGKKNIFGFSITYVGQLGYKKRDLILGRTSKEMYEKFTFYDHDGTRIAVLPEYEFQAKKYAELFQKKFDQEVKVFVTRDIGPFKRESLEEKVGENPFDHSFQQFYK
ncbi:MAG TPA: hypothetical protein VEC16_07200 [Alphaproteobacteria bacterium]|nr:hypothetical protein [Alphaproteobacteria bacterium]